MAKIIFHIGVAKTGTTSLENNLFNRLSHCANLGRPNHGHPLYQNFFRGIMHAEDADVARLVQPFVEYVQEQARQYPVVMISDESLQGRGIYSYFISRIQSFFPEAEILITIRNQLSAIQSYYCDEGYRLKNVPAMDDFNRKKQILFNEFLEYAFSAPDRSYLFFLDYQRLLAVLSQHFPKDKIHVLLFENMIKSPAVFFEKMGALLDCSASELLAIWQEGAPQKTRKSDRYLRYQYLRTKVPLKSIRRYLPGLTYLLPRLERFLKGGKVPTLDFTELQLMKLNEIYAAGNRYLRDEYQLDLAKWDYPLS